MLNRPWHHARRARFGEVFLLLFGGLWVVLLNNARIADNLPTHVGYSWVSIPRPLRLLEVTAVLGAFVLLQPFLLRARLRDLNALAWVFIASGALSGWLLPTYLPGQLQGLYLYVAPFLVFLIAWVAEPRRTVLFWLAVLFGTHLLVSTLVALLVQYPAVGANGDWVHGYFSDAHVFGSFLAIASCTAFGVFLSEGGFRFLLVSLLLLGLSYFPANEKLILFNVLWCAVALLVQLVRHPKNWRPWLAAALACVALLSAVRWQEQNSASALRYRQITGRTFAELGPVRAWLMVWRAIGDSPSALAIGLGPGNFAGVAAARTIQERPEMVQALPTRARDVLLMRPSHDSAVAWTSNSWSNLLAEFGLVGLALFFLQLVFLTRPLIRWNPVDRWDRTVRLLALVALAAIVWQGAFSPYTNWAEPVLVYPTMILFAYCHHARRAGGVPETSSKAALR